MATSKRQVYQNQFFAGLDLGQSHDYTAIAVVERLDLVGRFDAVAYANRKITERHLRYLERAPLGTPYTEIVQRVERVVRKEGVQGRCHLIVDATGVGRPVVDMLRNARLPCKLMPTLITGGSEGTANGYYQAPKRDLIAGLQLLLEQQDLKIAAALDLGRTLLNEMMEMRTRVTLAGNEQYGAWREGTHDDLVLAVALACWGMNRVYPHPPQGKDAYCVFPGVRW